MSLHLTLDRGDIDSLGEARANFRFHEQPPKRWRGVLVTGRGDVAVRGQRLWTTGEPPGGEPYLLGRDSSGQTYLAWMVEQECPLPAGVRFAPITDAATTLSDNESFLAAQAVALARWHDRDRFCSRCGSAVSPIEAGWASYCAGCENVEYPRTDPVVIVRVTDASDRVLLAHNAAWPAPTLSLPAGFIEAGETPRRAIARELWEEVSVAVTGFKYLGAQPWPSPRSLMLGFHAQTVEESPVPTPDRVEIDYAEFFSRERYRQMLREEKIFAPRASSIAASMLADWLGEPLFYPQGR